jgi:hypothetical protein
VSGTVVEVHKLGDRWRAEISAGEERIVVTGLAGARIPANAMAEGRRATVVGIVRRPYPGASDRRWSIVPRSPADIVATGSGQGRAQPGAVEPTQGTDATALGRGAVPDVDIADLADRVGQVVRVGGLIEELTADGFWLDDGTAVGRVVLRGAAAEYLPLLEPSDAVNATGLVGEDADGLHVVIDDPAGLARVGDPTAGTVATAPPADSAQTAASEEPERGSRLAGGLLGPGETGAAGVLGVVLVTLLSLAISLLRRHRARRLLAARVAARVASVAALTAPKR